MKICLVLFCVIVLTASGQQKPGGAPGTTVAVRFAPNDWDPCALEGPDQKAYRAWRQHIELITYKIGPNGAGRFGPTIKNVTPEDDVYLRIDNPNPLLLVPAVTVTQTGSAPQELLTASGSSPVSINFWTAAAKTSSTSASDAATSADTSNTGATGTLKTMMLNSSNQLDKEKTHQDATSKHDSTLQKELDRVNEAIQSLQARLRDFDRVTDQAQAAAREFDRSVSLLRDEFTTLEQRGLGGNLQTNWAAEVDRLFGTPFQSVQRSADHLRSIVNDVQARRDSVVSAANVLKSQTPKLKAAQGEGLGDSGQQTAIAQALSAIAELNGIGTQLDPSVQLVLQARANTDSALQALQKAFGEARRAGDEGYQCVSLGRYHPLTDVTVDVKITRRADFFATAAPTPTATTRRTIKRTVGPTDADGSEQITEEISQDSTSASSDGSPAAQAVVKTSTPDPAAGAGGTDSATKPQAVVLSQYKFSVLAPTHLLVTMGAAVSGLANPTFDFVVVNNPASATAGSSDPKQIKIIRKSDAHAQVRPTVNLGLYPRARYLFAEHDDGDNYEPTKARDWTPYPVVGFSVSDPTENFFFGGGWDIFRGINITGGIHIGHVKRLISGYSENTTFAQPDSFKIDDVTEMRWRPSWYASVGIDPAALIKVLTGGSKQN